MVDAPTTWEAGNTDAKIQLRMQVQILPPVPIKLTHHRRKSMSDTMDMMIVIPDLIEKKHVHVAESIMTRNGERQWTETWRPAYEDKKLIDMPTSIGGYFYGYIPKAWLVPFKNNQEE